ncbi:MAG: hypothetical protein GY751_02795, partial [Bacteroidetes bacterium]|nr:hypothetical protein [Bacteroidota bacterium]
SLCLAKIPEPSNVYYGNITIGEIPITAQNTGIVVSLRIGDTVVSSYQMGEKPELGDRYLLIVPMDVEGNREANTAREGDVATILVSGIETTPFTINRKGKIELKDLTVESTDSDNDGMPDIYENENRLNPFDSSDAAKDPDEDGLTNLQEYNAGTDPNLKDSDNDGMNDGYEVAYGFDPLDGSDAALDSDGDGYTNVEEAENGTNPTIPNSVQPFRVEIARSITGHDGNVAALAYDDGQLVSASQHEANIKIWDLADGQMLDEVESGSQNGINALAVSGNWIFAGTGDSDVLQFNTGGVSPVLTRTLTQAQGSILALSVYDNQVIAGSADGSVAIWDIDTGGLQDTWTAHTDEFISGLEAVDGYLYTLGTFPSKSLKRWRWVDKVRDLTIIGAETCCDLTNLYLSDGKLFIPKLYGTDSIEVFNMSDGFSTQRLTGQLNNVTSLSAANHRFFSGDSEGMVNVWGFSSGEFLMSFKAHAQPIRSLVATDTQLMTGDASGLIKVWNLYDDASGDSDFDGMLDSWEMDNGLNPNSDTDKNDDDDNDGLDNLKEYINQTDPQDEDTDDDLIPDNWEVENGLNPNEISDADADPDEDGATNLQEYENGTDPNVANQVTITIDGNFAEWAGFSNAITDADDVADSAGPDWLDIKVKNNGDSLFLYFTSANGFDLPSANLNIYIDADNNASTGYSIGNIGSDLLIQGTEVFQQSPGVNKGGLLTTISAEPTTGITEMEMALPLSLITDIDASADTLQIMFQNDAAGDLAPDSGSYDYPLIWE